MSLSVMQRLPLPAEARLRLEQEAARRGQEPDDLVAMYVLAGLNTHTEDIATEQTQAAADEKAERFRQWADSQPRRNVPVIPLEALDREHIYGDHA